MEPVERVGKLHETMTVDEITVRSSMEQDAESRWSRTWLCVGAWLAPLLVFQERRDGAVMAYPIGCYRTYLACMLRAVASCIFLQLWFGDDLSTYWCLMFLPVLDELELSW